MKVPLIVLFPGGIGAGQRVTNVVSLVDVAPTIIQFLDGSEASAFGRGRSLLPLIEGSFSDSALNDVIPGMRVNRKKYYRPFKKSRGDLNVVIRRGARKGIWNGKAKRSNSWRERRP